MPTPGKLTTITPGTQTVLPAPITPAVNQVWQVELDNLSPWILAVNVSGKSYSLAPGVAQLYTSKTGPAEVAVTPSGSASGPGQIMSNWAIVPDSIPGTFPAAVRPTTTIDTSGGAVEISASGPITVEQSNPSNLQVATDILNVTPSPAPSGTFSGSVSGIPAWATHLVVSATVPSNDVMSPMSVHASGGVSLANYTPTPLYLTSNQGVVSLPVIGGIDSSVDFDISQVVSGESGTAPTYGFFAYAHVPRIPRPQIEVASAEGSADAFLLTNSTSTQVFELLDIDLNINASANSGANVQMVPPGGTIGGYHKIIRCGLAATSSSTAAVSAHLNFLDSENNGYVLLPGTQLGVSVSSCYYNASVVYRTLVT